MKPYYEHAGITIYHGDCRSILPELGPASFFVLDPPFNLGKKYGERTNDARSPEIYWAWFDEVLSSCFGAGAADCVAYLFHSDKGIFEAKPRCEVIGWTYVQMLIWYGPNGFRGALAAQSSPKWSYSHEAILYLEKGEGLPAEKKPRWFMSCLPIPRPQTNFAEGKDHPAQKPVELAKRLINFHADFEGMIVDPFCGSGSTLIAAKKLGRRAIGIEIEEKYCEIAAKRLSQEVLPLHG